MNRWLPVPLSQQQPTPEPEHLWVAKPPSLLSRTPRALEALGTLAELVRLGRNLIGHEPASSSTESPTYPLARSYELAVTWHDRRGQRVTIHERQTIVMEAPTQVMAPPRRAGLSWRPGWRVLGLAGMVLVLGLARVGRLSERRGQWPPAR